MKLMQDRYDPDKDKSIKEKAIVFFSYIVSMLFIVLIFLSVLAALKLVITSLLN